MAECMEGCGREAQDHSVYCSTCLRGVPVSADKCVNGCGRMAQKNSKYCEVCLGEPVGGPVNSLKMIALRIMCTRCGEELGPVVMYKETKKKIAACLCVECSDKYMSYS